MSYGPFGSSRMRDLLIEHLDGVLVPVVRPGTLKGAEAIEAAHRFKTIESAVAHGWIVYDHGTNGRKITSVATKITDKGRETIGQILAEWADAIDRLPKTGRPYFAGERLRAILCISQPSVRAAPADTTEAQQKDRHSQPLHQG